MLCPPRVTRVLTGEIAPVGWDDALPGEALGDAVRSVSALISEAEYALDGVEVGLGVVGHREPSVYDCVAEGRFPVHPQALLGLGAHASLHVGGQLLGVALRQPREDGPDELSHGAIGRVLLGERDDLDVGLVQSAQGPEAVEHVPGDAGEGPDIEAVNLGRAGALAGAAGLGLGFRTSEQALVAAALAGRAAADALVNEPVLGGNDHAVSGGAALDLHALLVDGLVLARVAAPQVGGADAGHGDSLVEVPGA